MGKKEHIYDAFGELVYVVAMADGLIQEKELEALEKIIASHPKSREIKWSFDYEMAKGRSVEEVYKKVIISCHENGPDSEYRFLVEMLEEVANASSGIDPKERKVIDNFIHDLTERLRKDIEKINR